MLIKYLCGDMRAGDGNILVEVRGMVGDIICRPRSCRPGGRRAASRLPPQPRPGHAGQRSGTTVRASAMHSPPDQPSLAVTSGTAFGQHDARGHAQPVAWSGGRRGSPCSASTALAWTTPPYHHDRAWTVVMQRRGLPTSGARAECGLDGGVAGHQAAAGSAASRSARGSSSLLSGRTASRVAGGDRPARRAGAARPAMKRLRNQVDACSANTPDYARSPDAYSFEAPAHAQRRHGKGHSVPAEAAVASARPVPVQLA